MELNYQFQIFHSNSSNEIPKITSAIIIKLIIFLSKQAPIVMKLIPAKYETKQNNLNTTAYYNHR